MTQIFASSSTITTKYQNKKKMDSRTLSVLQWFCILLFFGGVAREASCDKVFNVLDFGATRDGKTDSSKAFLNAWKEACGTEGGAKVWIPRGYYFVKPVSFDGPCKGPMKFQMQGHLKAPHGLAYFDGDYWIRFQRIDGLKVYGFGTFDGDGASTWPYNDCQKNPSCTKLPTSIRFDFINNAKVRRIHSLNSKLCHINIFACKQMLLEDITITAPHDSPNTDGIHIGASEYITISHSTIKTGDDCVSLSPGTKHIEVSDVVCGPGHGISVGSMGRTPNEGNVTDLIVKNCTFLGTTNGVRIKTWAPSYPGIVNNFTFQDIRMDNVHNPIFIDQQYCPVRNCRHQSESKIFISDVTYDNIWGTSATKVAVNLLCSKLVPCRNILLKNIYLTWSGRRHQEEATTSCTNAIGFSSGRQVPPSCFPREIEETPTRKTYGSRSKILTATMIILVAITSSTIIFYNLTSSIRAKLGYY